MHAMQTGAGLFASIAGGFVIDQLGIKALLILCVVMAGIGTVLVFLFADQGGKRKEALNG
jgi:predicted MFS family arabinose efflux permease